MIQEAFFYLYLTIFLGAFFPIQCIFFLGKWIFEDVCLFYTLMLFLSHFPPPLISYEKLFHSSLFICFSTALFVLGYFFKTIFNLPFLRWSFSSRCAWIFHPFYYLIFDYHSCTLDSQSGLTYYITSDWRLNTKGSTYWWKPENASTFSSVKNFKTYLVQFFRFIASKN